MHERTYPKRLLLQFQVVLVHALFLNFWHYLGIFLIPLVLTLIFSLVAGKKDRWKDSVRLRAKSWPDYMLILSLLLGNIRLKILRLR